MFAVCEGSLYPRRLVLTACGDRRSTESITQPMPHVHRHADPAVASPRKRNVAPRRNRQLAPPSGLAIVGPAASTKLTGRLPSNVTLLTLNRSGAVHASSVSQLPVASALTPTERPSPRLKLANGCRNVELTSSRSLAPLTDQIWLKRKPIVHGPGCVRATTDGPIPNFSDPSDCSSPRATGRRGPRPRLCDRTARARRTRSRRCRRGR